VIFAVLLWKVFVTSQLTKLLINSLIGQVGTRLLRQALLDWTFSPVSLRISHGTNTTLHLTATHGNL